MSRHGRWHSISLQKCQRFILLRFLTLPFEPRKLWPMTDEQIVAQHLAQNPHDDPKNNAEMRESVNSSDYVDRGMWGPMGGKNGTVSQIWLDEWKRLDLGGASEFGLMTVVPPPNSDGTE